MTSNLNLDDYYGSEAEQFSFYRVPKTLLTDPHYKSVSIEAKVLYGLLLDRMGLSVRNGWMDCDRRIYIYVKNFTLPPEPGQTPPDFEPAPPQEPYGAYGAVQTAEIQQSRQRIFRP